MSTLTCFISAPSGVNTNIIKKILEEKGIEVIQLVNEIFIGDLISKKIDQLISNADFILAILDETKSNSNVFVEIGMAKALKKKIIIISPPGIILPSHLQDIIIIKANISNTEALEFNVEQALPFLSVTKKRKPKHYVVKITESVQVSDRLEIKKQSKTNPLGPIANELRNELRNITEKNFNQSGIDLVKHVIQKSGIKVVVENRTTKDADFAVWVNELGSILDNPFLIELKFSIDHQHISNLIDQISSHFQKGKRNWALILFLKGPAEIELDEKVRSSTILFLQIEKFLKLLEQKSFGEIILQLRNNRVHGVMND